MSENDRHYQIQREIGGDLFDLELRTLRRQQANAGVLAVDVDENYSPVDPDYQFESLEEALHDGFITTMSFLSIVTEDRDFFDTEVDVIAVVNARFDCFVDELSFGFDAKNDRANASLVRNLTMQGAADFAKKRYGGYLQKFIDGDVKDEFVESQHVENWMWAYLILNHAADVV
jgi:hypothetical protein